MLKVLSSIHWLSHFPIVSLMKITYDAKVMAQNVDPYFSPKEEC